MWRLLEQVAQNEVENLDEVVVAWSDVAKDIPEDWKAAVSRCLDPDPNERMRLSELVDYWDAAMCKDRAHSVCTAVL